MKFRSIHSRLILWLGTLVTLILALGGLHHLPYRTFDALRRNR